MAATNYERVGKGMELLKQGLGPFVEREMKAVFKGQAQAQVLIFLRDDPMAKKPIHELDVSLLLKLMEAAWKDVFKRTLGKEERSFVNELQSTRNRWAHQEAFSSSDAYRALDSMSRLLSAVSAPEAAEVDRIKDELLRVQYDEKVRTERRKAAVVETQATDLLKPWRDVVKPHPDVASGRYQQAEFAADLWQVYLGQGSEEYKNPVDFFRRTFLTESLKRLLVGAVDRLSGKGGDPVVQLQTNFGGGKTHSMLAMYHLFSGAAPSELAGIEDLLKGTQTKKVPAARRVVLVGNKISPGNPATKSDGTVVRTLWGELVWQLGYAAGGAKVAKKAFARIAEDDKNATSPGDALRELLVEYGPCLVLIDEWVAYARQLHDGADLPGGTFETQFTFAQTLTEAAKAAQNCLVVVSLPASDSGGSPHARGEEAEVGGERGAEALRRLSNVVGRIESSWKPASTEEGFEIVRRRLFEPMVDPAQFKDRDVVARAFGDFYRKEKEEFPSECQEADYERRIKAAYPIHPEVFDRLYTDWATLAKFQRTRGVLRLMAAVIHSLWESGDRSPLILPCSLPLDDQPVQFELAHYLPDNWAPVIEKDIDGATSLPLEIDRTASNLGRIAACRRVARAIYLGSAPLATAAHKGLEDRQVKLGCAMPGETVALFGDALRRLSARATYLYADGARYWYSTQPTVTKIAEDRTAQIVRDDDAVQREIERRVRLDAHKRGEFAGVHPLPKSSQDVPDDRAVRLVILGVDAAHTREASPALAAGKAILGSRGTSPRLFQNALVFLAPDQARIADLCEAAARYLAWESIFDDREALNLTGQQVKQAEAQKAAADSKVDAQIPETFNWLLVPVQKTPKSELEWQTIRQSGAEALAVRASTRLVRDELLITSFGASTLRMELDRIPLWRGDHVEIRQLIDDFARYPYLPRLADSSILVGAVRKGFDLLTWQKDSFAFAESYNQKASRYRGLAAGKPMYFVDREPAGLLIKPDVAQKQLDEEAEEEKKRAAAGGGAPAPGPTPGPGGKKVKPEPEKKLRRFHGSIVLDETRVSPKAAEVAAEVIAHLVGLPKANVTVTLEIEAEIPDGAPENVVRTVTENAQALKFKSQGFEDE